MAESKAITKQERVQTIGGYLEEMKPHMSAVISHGIDVEKMTRMAITVIRQNDRLLQCTNVSLMGAIMECAQLSLYPDSTILGHAHLVPFNVKGTLICQLIPGYRGLIELMMRSGRVANVEPRAVFEGDEFYHEYGMQKVLKHVPKFPPPPDEDAAKALIAAYCVVRYRVGEPEFVVMSRRDCEKIRDQSPAGRNKTGPWYTNFVPMCLKSTVRFGSKYQALSPDVDRAVSLDETYDAGIEQTLPTPPITIEADFTDMSDKKPEDLGSVVDDLEAAVADAEASGTIEPEQAHEPEPAPETGVSSAPDEDPGPEPDATPDSEASPLKELAKQLCELRGDEQGMKDLESLKRSARIPEHKGLDELTDKQAEKLGRSLKTMVDLAAKKK